jgi:hypothetical protein
MVPGIVGVALAAHALTALVAGCSINVNTCAGVTCGDGEVCQNGSCVDPCANVTCEPDADECTVDVCDNGVCSHDPATCSSSSDCPAGCNFACINSVCRGF